MKITFYLLLSLLGTLATAEEIHVAIPACFMYEFQSLEAGIGRLKELSAKLCDAKAKGSQPVLMQTAVEQTASCRGFKISAQVDCEKN